MLCHAFHDLNLHRVYLHVVAANSRAHAFYERLGFVLEGMLRDAVYKAGTLFRMWPCLVCSRPNSSPTATGVARYSGNAHAHLRDPYGQRCGFRQLAILELG
jgi:hypothetical protein